MGPPVSNNSTISFSLPVYASSLIFISLKKDSFFEYNSDAPAAELRFHHLFKGSYHNEARASNQIFKEILNHVKGVYNDKYFSSLPVKDNDHDTQNPAILITWRAYSFTRDNPVKSSCFKFMNEKCRDVYIDLTFQKGLTVFGTKKNKKMLINILKDPKVTGIIFFARLVNIEFLGSLLSLLEKICHLKALYIFYDIEGVKHKVISLCNNFVPIKNIDETYLIQVSGHDWRNRLNENIEFTVHSEQLFT